MEQGGEAALFYEHCARNIRGGPSSGVSSMQAAVVALVADTTELAATVSLGQWFR